MARPAKYQWNEWADGKPRVLIEGRDFRCTIESLRVQMCCEARKRGLYARTKFAPGGPGTMFDPQRNGIIFRFTPDQRDELIFEDVLPQLGEYVLPHVAEQLKHIFKSASSHSS